MPWMYLDILNQWNCTDLINQLIFLPYIVLIVDLVSLLWRKSMNQCLKKIKWTYIKSYECQWMQMTGDEGICMQMISNECRCMLMIIYVCILLWYSRWLKRYDMMTKEKAKNQIARIIKLRTPNKVKDALCNDNKTSPIEKPGIISSAIAGVHPYCSISLNLTS